MKSRKPQEPIIIHQGPPIMKEALTVVETAEAISLGRTTVFRLIREGRIKVVRCGRSIIVPRTEIQAFLQAEAGAAPMC